MEDRKTVLLRATYDILKKANEGSYVEDVFSLTANYDGTDCDGYCLMEDIANELEIDVDLEEK